ncbi:tmk1 [[Candida] subhashii]|uniref:Mitogen-activated protein kinase n=1 Tax=[Candida] subhashii TaxID=561895 RepID=A0A8J5Q9A0_9ASCO|nr:tmk1 [[Candida] subhashii]KAG7661596.1 tmk1 [[Candida] subhashii]
MLASRSAQSKSEKPMASAQSRKVVFNISQNLKVTKILGEGAYGIVALATHLPTGIEVAIKKIMPFERPLFCLRTLREIKLLTKFNSHDNIIKLYDVQKPLNYESFNEVYLIQEYMPSDLHNIIATQTLSDQHVQYFVYQILKGLKMIHSAGVIHRDLKPSNLLVNEQCDLKICDFGLARLNSALYNTPTSPPLISQLTEYVATRWYRAPEIMLSASQYSTAIDVWSVGCILAEMLTYKPLFPGKDYIHQLRLILDILGSPGEEDLRNIKSSRARTFIKSLPQREQINLTSYITKHPYRIAKHGRSPQVNPLAVDLLEKLLIFDAKKRITVDQALEHPYLASYHDPNDEPTTSPIPIEEFEFDIDKQDLDIGELKIEIYHEIINQKRD